MYMKSLENFIQKYLIVVTLVLIIVGIFVSITVSRVESTEKMTTIFIAWMALIYSLLSAIQKNDKKVNKVRLIKVKSIQNENFETTIENKLSSLGNIEIVNVHSVGIDEVIIFYKIID